MDKDLKELTSIGHIATDTGYKRTVIKLLAMAVQELREIKKTQTESEK